MKKSAYYQTMYQRHNIIKDALLNFFLSLSSWPRMLLEVPIRRNFGERYFNMATAISILVVLGGIPFFLIAKMRYGYDGPIAGLVAGKFLTWYVYLAWFLYSAIKRQAEIKRLPSVFDFARFSLSTGRIDQRFFDISLDGSRPTTRTVETLIEPGLFFFTGLLIWIIGQPIGFVLFVSSIFYSLSYIAAYREGDNFLMDKIDEQICNEELVKTFVNDSGSANSRGFNFYGRRPANPDVRRRVAELFKADEEKVVAV